MTENIPEFCQFNSQETLSLPPGTILRLSHEAKVGCVIFECTDINYGSDAEGILSINEGDSTVTHYDAEMNTSPPAGIAVTPDKPYIEFIIKEPKSRTIIHFPFTKLETAFDPELAAAAYQQETERQMRQPFQSKAAQETLANLIHILKRISFDESEMDKSNAYSITAYLIEHRLLD